MSTLDGRPSPPSRSPGGLGRGLAGILDRSEGSNADEGSGLGQLLGRPVERSSPRVRRFVADLALEAIASSFDAEAVLLVRRDDDRPSSVICTRVPPSWQDRPGLEFEMQGRLWGELADRQAGLGRPLRPRSYSALVDGKHAWFGRRPLPDGVLAAAVVRGRPFTSAEETALARVVRSVAGAIGDPSPGPPDGTRLSVTAGSAGDGAGRDGDGEGERWSARVLLEEPEGRRSATGRGPTRESATAAAALALSGVEAEIGFAGQAEVDGLVVSIVIVDPSDGLGAPAAPLLGVAVSDRRSGPAEAVMAALGG